MASAREDIHKPLSFDKTDYFFRKVPFALGAGLLGLVLLYSAPSGPNARAIYLLATMLICGGLGFAAFAFWRRKHPGQPTLLLSSTGIRYRIDKNLTLTIPWSEVAGVDAADITFRNRGISWKRRDVPVVLVSERFHRSQVRPETWWHRGLAWQYHLIPKDGMVQVAFFNDVLSQPAEGLREAIERRWRAFSRHPNAQKPSPPRAALGDRPGRWRLTRGQKAAAAIAFAVVALPLVWHWRWGHAWLRSSVSEGIAKAYAGDVLKRQAVPARRSDGRMIMVWPWDVSDIGGAECHSDIVRDTAAETFVPAYDVSTDCLADLTLADGAAAVAVFKLVVTTYDVEYELGKVTRGSALVPAVPSLEEAEQRLCVLRELGCGTGKETAPAG